jgi:tetratricopeptide (TPR) repeat protein
MLENPGAAVSIGTHQALRWIRYLVALAVLSARVLAQTGPAPSKEEFESFLHRGFQFHEQSAYDKALPLLQSAYRLQPRDYFVNLLLGIEMLRTGQATNAIAFLKTAAKVRPNEEFPLEYLGEAEASLGHYAEAAAAYIAAQRAAPGSAQSSVTLADFSLDRLAKLTIELRGSGKGLAAAYRLQALALAPAHPSSRVELLARAADLDDDAHGVWSEIALAEFTANDLVAARQSVNRAIDKDANDLHAWEVQTMIAANDEDAKYVVGRLNEIAERSPSALMQIFHDWPRELHIPDPATATGPAAKFLACLQRADCTPNGLSSPVSAHKKLSGASPERLYREQRWEQVAARTSPSTPDHQRTLQRGVALAHLNRCEDAISALERSLQSAPSTEAAFWLSVCYAREAANAAERVQQASGDDIDLHIIRGDVLLRLQGNTQDAIQEYQAALAQRRNDASLWARLAESQLGAGQLEGAKQSAQTALTFEAKCPPAKRILAKIAMQERDYAAALPYLRELVAHDPRELTTRVDLGTACAQTGALEEALANLGPALQNGYPDEKGSLHYLLGTVLRRMGKSREAERAFQAARELSEHFQQASHQEQDEQR